MENRLGQQKERIENLQDKMLDDQSSMSDYTVMKQRIDKAMVEMEIELEGILSVKSSWEKFLYQGISFLSNLQESYKKTSLEQKEQILSSAL